MTTTSQDADMLRENIDSGVKAVTEEMKRVQAEEEEAGESEFEKTRRESDEAAFERKREFQEEQEERFEDIRKENEARDIRQREFDNEFFRLIREKRFEEAEKLSIEFDKEILKGDIG